MTKIPPEPKRNNSIEGLIPPLQVKARGIISYLESIGLHPILGETLRSKERAKWLYGYGRTFAIGKPIKTKVTPEYNKHCKGKAFDVYFLDDNGKIIWNPAYRGWIELAKIAIHYGLVSGYYWKMHDSPHVETKS